MKYFFLIFLIPYLSISQINIETSAPELDNSNTDAFEFSTISNNNVKAYTGKFNIDVDIFNIKVKGVNIPIKLIYHSKGHKVADEASSVGLGWDLTTDFEITQEVNYVDDFGRYKSRLKQLDFDCIVPKQTGGVTAASVMNAHYPFILGFDQEWNQENPDCFVPINTLEQTRDTEPDIFHFNIPGFSGEFLMDWETENFKCLTDSRYKIFYNGNFKIVSPDGNIFYFELRNNKKILRNINTMGGIPQSSTLNLSNESGGRTYKLTEIYSSKGDIIKFDYQNTPTFKNYPKITEGFRFYEKNPGSTLDPYYNGYFSSYYVTEENISYLKTISYNNHRINFTFSDRVDMNFSQKVDKVEIQKKTSSTSYKTINEFDFFYSYFTSDSGGNNWNNLINQYEDVIKSQDELTKRLKLDSVTYNSELTYKFRYNSQNLPIKTSYSTDYWGFYNGQHLNESFFPNMARFGVEEFEPRLFHFLENNKSPSLPHNKAGMLEFVEYPTGLTKQIEYELNTFENFRVPKINESNRDRFEISSGNGDPSYKDFKVLNSSVGFYLMDGSGILSTRGCDFNQTYDKTYIKIEHFKPSINQLIDTYYTPIYGLASLNLLDENSPDFNQTLYNQHIQEVKMIQMRYDDNQEVLLSDLKYKFGPGVLLIRTFGGCGQYKGTVNSSQASVSFDYYAPDPLEPLSYGSGLRVKSISNYEDIDTPTPNLSLKKSYKYHDGKIFKPAVQIYKKNARHYSFDVIANEVSDSSCLSQLNQANSELWRSFTRFTQNPTTENKRKLEAARNQLEQARNVNCFYTDVQVLDKYFIGSDFNFSGNNYSSNSYLGYSNFEETVMNKDYPEDFNKGKGKVSIKFINKTASNFGTGDVLNVAGYTADLNIPANRTFPENGKIKSEEYYKRSGRDLIRLKSKRYSYSKNIEASYWSTRTIKTDTYRYIMPGTEIPDIRTKYLTYVHPYKQGKTLLSEIIDTDYYNNGLRVDSLSSTINFSYDNKNQVVSKIEDMPDQDLIKTEIKYPYSDSNNNNIVLSSMVDKNFLTSVVEESIKVNNETTVRKLKTFGSKNNGLTHSFPLRKEEYFKENSTDAFNTKEYEKYDDDHNLIIFTENKEFKTRVVWGYFSRHPVAVIKNYPKQANTGISYLIEDVINASNDFAKNSYQSKREILEQKINELRNNPGLQKSFITSFIYKPLTGVLSETNTRGESINYEYDELNRLKAIRDSYGKLIEETEYNYKN